MEKEMITMQALSVCGRMATDGEWIHWDGVEIAHSDNPAYPVSHSMAVQAAKNQLAYIRDFAGVYDDADPADAPFYQSIVDSTPL